jgi:hypothetical protein
LDRGGALDAFGEGGRAAAGSGCGAACGNGDAAPRCGVDPSGKSQGFCRPRGCTSLGASLRAPFLPNAWSPSMSLTRNLGGCGEIETGSGAWGAGAATRTGAGAATGPKLGAGSGARPGAGLGWTCGGDCWLEEVVASGGGGAGPTRDHARSPRRGGRAILCLPGRTEADTSPPRGWGGERYGGASSLRSRRRARAKTASRSAAGASRENAVTWLRCSASADHPRDSATSRSSAASAPIAAHSLAAAAGASRRARHTVAASRTFERKAASPMAAGPSESRPFMVGNIPATERSL